MATKKKSFEGKMPPLKLWKETEQAPPGPNELQARYFINKLPPEDRPHWHTQDILLSIGGMGSGKTYGGVVRLLDSCATTKKLKAYLAGMDFKLLKRNTWEIIEDALTIDEPWDHPASRNQLHDQNNELKFTNGSRLVCINLEQNLAKKIGYTADIQMIDEAHLLPDEAAYELLIGRARGTATQIRQVILCTNPEKTKEGWMNQTFDLKVFDGIDTSERPVEKLVGPKCTCQFCTTCLEQRKVEAPWIPQGEDMVCSVCAKRKAFWTWKGKKYHCPGNQQYTRVIKSESFHNPHLTDDYFQGMRNAYDEEYYNIMVKGKLNAELREEYALRKYSKDHHELLKAIPVDYSKDFYWGLDFNRKPQSSVVAQFEDINQKEHFVLKEEICLFGKPSFPDYPYGKGEGASAKDVAREFIRRFRSRYQGTMIHIYGDPKAFNKGHLSDETAYDILIEMLEDAGFRVNCMADDAQISVSDRLELTDHWLEEQLILLNPYESMPWTVKSFSESKMDPKDVKGTKVNKRQDENAARSMNRKRIYPVSHFLEASGYMFFKLFPMSDLGLRFAVMPDGKVLRENRRGEVETVEIREEVAEPLEQYHKNQVTWEDKLKDLRDRRDNPHKYGGLTNILGLRLKRPPPSL